MTPMLYDLVLMHIPIKFHEDIPNGYRVMRRRKNGKKKDQRAITWSLKNEE